MRYYCFGKSFIHIRLCNCIFWSLSHFVRSRKLRWFLSGEWDFDRFAWDWNLTLPKIAVRRHCRLWECFGCLSIYIYRIFSWESSCLFGDLMQLLLHFNCSWWAKLSLGSILTRALARAWTSLLMSSRNSINDRLILGTCVWGVFNFLFISVKISSLVLVIIMIRLL